MSHNTAANERRISEGMAERVRIRKERVNTAAKLGCALNYKQRGYEEISTGGNCTAMYFKLPSAGVHILVTDGDNRAPVNWECPVCAGLYAQNGLWLGTMNAPTSDALFGMIARGEWEQCAS